MKVSRVIAACTLTLSIIATALMIAVFILEPQKEKLDILLADVWFFVFAFVATVASTVVFELRKRDQARVLRVWLVVVSVVIFLNIVWFQFAPPPNYYAGP